MSENVQIVPIIMPQFEAIVPENIYKEATIPLGIVVDNIPCGCLCMRYSDHEYRITWLYIEKSRRRQGLGRELLNGAIRLLRDIEEVFPVEITFSSEDKDLQCFFQNLDHFSQREVGSIFVIDSKTRRESDFYSQLLKTKESECRSFFQYEEAIRANFLYELRMNYPSLEEYIKENMRLFNRKLSLAYGTGRIRAAVFVKVMDKQIEVVVFHADDLPALSVLFVAGVKKMEESYPDYDIKISCFRESTKGLVKELFAADETRQILIASWDMRLPGEFPAFD